MISDILEEITEEDIKLLEEIKQNALYKKDYIDNKALDKANAINKMLIVYKDYKALRKQREKVKGYIVKELIEINKHQYAKGSRRLKKCLRMLEDFEDNYYRSY